MKTKVIRPEAISLSNASKAKDTKRPFSAKVEVTEPTGAETLAILDFGGHEFTAKLDADLTLSIGTEAQFMVDLAKLVCFDTKTETLID